MPNGDYEQRRGNDGTVLTSGQCAGCGWLVTEYQPSVVLYSTDGTPGGIFHDMPPHFSCRPTGPQWFGVGEGDVTEAPDL